MFIKYKDFEGKIDIKDYSFTPEGDILLSIDSKGIHAPQFVRLYFPEVGGIILKFLFFLTK